MQTTTETSAAPMDAQELRRQLRTGSNASGLMVLLFYGLVFAFSGVLAVIMKQFGDIDSGFLGALYGFLAYTLQYPVTVPLILLVFHFAGGRKLGLRLRDAFRKPAVPLSKMFRWIVICLGIIYASTMISRMFWMLLQSVFQLDMVAQSFAAEPHWLSMVTNLVAMILYAPIFEELMFRGTLLRSVEKGGELPAALLCGILFGLWHINFDQTIFTGVMGFVAAMLYFKTRTLLAPMLLHATMNTIGAVQSLFMGSFDPYEMMKLETDAEMLNYMTENLSGIAMIMLSGLLVMGLMGLGIILLIIELVNHKELFTFRKNECGLSTKQVLFTCMTSPLMLITILALIVMTVLRAMGLL